MAETFEVEGLRELEQKLLKLGGKVGVKLLRQAGREAMKPVLQDAIRGANVDTGDLRQSMQIGTTKGKKDAVVNINVGPIRKRALKSQGGREFSRTNAKAIAQEYGTKRQKADPFLRPALQRNANKVLRIFKKALMERIEKEARKP